jgi:hypothetical protein
MDQPPRVQPADGRGQRDRNAQEFRHLDRSPEQPLERLATRVSQHQHEPARAPDELDRSCQPVAAGVYVVIEAAGRALIWLRLGPRWCWTALTARLPWLWRGVPVRLIAMPPRKW